VYDLAHVLWRQGLFNEAIDVVQHGLAVNEHDDRLLGLRQAIIANPRKYA
jgi:hypothetical protein